MEVAHSTPESFSSTFGKKIPLPLGQLEEETRRGAGVPDHLLESKIYVKHHGNSIIQLDPSVLNFRGFQLGKVYQQVLKLVNISSEVINVHVLPTQTKYFKTKYTKKFRLIPGLSYTVAVLFHPDEWRYFYDCIWIHCKGEENLLVPVHAYPALSDLHIPGHISLPPTALGHSVSRTVALNCSCSVDFEFKVSCIQPHRAFTVQPLSGVIAANGRVEILVTFTPLEYGTAQMTLQVVTSEFNSKPYTCTITGSSSPYLAISQQEKDGQEEPVLQKELLDPRSLSLVHLSRVRKKQKLKATLDGSKESGRGTRQPAVDVSSPAAVAKLLIQHSDKSDASPQVGMGFEARQAKEALFESRVCRDVQEERANHLRWQVRLGKDPVSVQTRKKILEEREKSNHEYKMKQGEMFQDEDLTRIQARMTVRRVLRTTDEMPTGVPLFHMYSNHCLEIGRRVFLLFQQAARKVLIRCRMNRRLMRLRPLIQHMKRLSRCSDFAEEPQSASVAEDADAPEEISALLKLSHDNLLPFTFPIFSSSQADEFDPDALGPVLVKPIEVRIKPNTPFFKLKVPQQYKLKGYKPVSTFEASASYIPDVLARPLRSGAQDEVLAEVVGRAEQEKRESLRDETQGVTFRAPAGLFRAPSTHPLRIFNPAPGLLSYKSPLPYLESDLDFHLCPLPKFATTRGRAAGTQKKFLDRKEVIRWLMTWKKFQSPVLSSLSSTPTLVKTHIPRMSDPFNDDLLPLTAPPALNCVPAELKEDLLDGASENGGVVLTLEMLRAEFPQIETSSSSEREPRQQVVWRQGQASKLGVNVQAALSGLKASVRTEWSSE